MTCPLCGKGRLPDIRVPGIQFLSGNLLYQGQWVAGFRYRDEQTKQGTLLELALRWWPNPVEYERCIFAVWQDMDAPLNTRNVLAVYGHNIRRKLQGSGLDFRSVNGAGYKFFLPDE